MRYPQKVGASDAEPKGLRGTDPRLAARYWGLSRSDYIEGADIWRLDPPNGNLLPWILIESPRGVANVREIARRLKVKNVGAVLFARSETGGTCSARTEATWRPWRKRLMPFSPPGRNSAFLLP